VTAHQPVDDMDTGLHMRDREAVASLLGLAQHARPRLTELDQRAAPEERIEIEDLGLVDLEDIPWIAGAVLLDQAIGLRQELLCIGPAPLTIGRDAGRRACAASDPWVVRTGSNLLGALDQHRRASRGAVA